MENNYLNPLFWQHGESEEALRTEIRKMKEGGIGSFIAEARPHPDYLGDGWWRDMNILLDEAKKQNMEMWILDDGEYPSGKANGLIRSKYPQYLKKFLIECHMDATGPLAGSSFLIDDWLLEGESVLRVVAAQRIDRGDALLPETLVDLTEKQSDGRLYWDVPDGEWRIFVIKITPYGQEEHTKDYVNPIDRDAVRAYINEIHEAHYAHLGEEFGKTFKGFFTDEPRFGSAMGYDRIIGKSIMTLPYKDGLLDELSTMGMGDFSKYLPCLWYDAGEAAPDARYLYMDLVSRLFAECFTGQIGDWCREHGVKYIGHVVEENGAHARLGYGAGHFFRAMQGLDTAGLDIVCNLLPEQTSGHYTTMFNYYDSDFNHWGISKMASSAAHVDPKKHGTAICEAFGAYGWFEGLKTMKWITDVLAVRGVNLLVPHAFSPMDYPDPDCPPHFYARGHNPQFRAFRVWADYANRVCHLISGGKHVAPVAVLYHAEAEWGGAAEPFEKAVKALMQKQIDSDVIPGDILADAELCLFSEEGITINQETYRVLVVPYAEYLPEKVARRLEELAQSGFPVVFTGEFPKRCYLGGSIETQNFKTAACAELADAVTALGLRDICLKQPDCELCYYHYQKNGADIYFFTNQSTKHTVENTVVFPMAKEAVLFDAMTGNRYQAEQTVTGNGCEVSLYLQPYESIFVLFGGETAQAVRPDIRKFTKEYPVDGTWCVSTLTAGETGEFIKQPFDAPGNLAVPGKLPDFSGTIRYETTFTCNDTGKAFLDLGAVYETAIVTVNGTEIGTRICPPYQLEIPEGILKQGENTLTVEVINTLVKENHDNPFDKYFPQEPTGLIGPVTVKMK